MAKKGIYKFKIGSKTLALAPNGDVYKSNKNGDLLGGTPLYMYFDGKWFTMQTRKLVKWPASSKATLTKKLKELSNPKAKKKLAKKKAPKKKAKKIKLVKKKKPIKKNKPAKKTKRKKGKLRNEITILDLPDRKMLTYRNSIFYIRKEKDDFIITRSINGVEEGFPTSGLKSMTDVKNFLKDTVDMEIQDALDKKNRKGGTQKTKWKYAKDDRIVFNYYGKFYIGTIVNVWLGNRQIVIKVDDPEFTDTVTLDFNDRNILGMGVDRKAKGPLPKRTYKKWIKKIEEGTHAPWEVIETEEGEQDIPPALKKQIETNFKKFFKGLKNYYTEDWIVKAIKRYMHDYTIKLSMERDGSLGKYKRAFNDVVINGNDLLMEAWQNLANTLAHEIIHYKLEPKRKQIQTFLKKNFWKMYSTPKGITRKRKEQFLKMFINNFRVMDAHTAIRLLRGMRGVPKLTGDEAYGYSHFFEMPSVFFARTVTKGDSLVYRDSKKLRDALWKLLKQQLRK